MIRSNPWQINRWNTSLKPANVKLVSQERQVGAGSLLAVQYDFANVVVRSWMRWVQHGSEDEDLAQMLGTMAARKTGLDVRGKNGFNQRMGSQEHINSRVLEERRQDDGWGVLANKLLHLPKRRLPSTFLAR